MKKQNNTNANQIPETGFLRLHQIVGDSRRGIAPLFPVSRSTFWAKVKAGDYPQPVKLGPRTTAWRAEDVRALIENPERRDWK